MEQMRPVNYEEEIVMGKQPYFKEIPVEKIFLDCQKENLYVAAEDNPRGRRVPHSEGDLGYQRDPWTRSSWIALRLGLAKDTLETDDSIEEAERGFFDMRKFRPLDVSKRANGMYAALDGGGRWLMAQLMGLKTVPCMVHEGLTREEEAELFSEFDSETYKLRSIDRFVAYLSALDPMAVAINDAVAPFRIAVKGVGTLKCVGPLSEIYTAFTNYETALRIIRRASVIIANTWCGFKGNDQWSVKRPIDGKFFLAVAILIEIAGKEFNEAALRKVLSRAELSPKNLQQTIESDFATKIKTDAFTLLAAKKLATHYNRAASLGREDKGHIAPSDVDNSDIVASMQDGRTFSARQREARLKAAAKAGKPRRVA